MMKQKSFDAVRQKSRALAVLLCLAVLLLTGCGGGGAAAPEPPASAPAAGRTDEDTASSPAAPAPSEPESVSSSTAVSESEAQSPQEPEVEDFLRCEPMDYTSVSAVCSGQEGTLIVVKVRVENTTRRRDANPQNLSQFGLESATRLHEAGFASNRASATAR